jgi:FixJ family two-component response regulator
MFHRQSASSNPDIVSPDAATQTAATSGIAGNARGAGPGVRAERPRLLIVDDENAQMRALCDTLALEGYVTRGFSSAQEALATLRPGEYDLLLTDLMMPEMDGITLINAAQQIDLAIGAIVMTGHGTIDTAVKAMQGGALDYILKPFKLNVILPVISRALEVRRLRRENAELVKIAEANERLIILDGAKNEFLAVISHELRSPLIGLFSVGDLILAGMPQTEDNGKLQGMFERSRQRLLSIIEDVLLLTQIDVNSEQFHSAPVSLNAALACAAKGATGFADSRHVKFTGPSSNWGLVVGDQELLARAMRSLLETAVKFSVEGKSVSIAREVVADTTRVIIESHGLTISSTAMPKFFEVFSIGETLTPGGDLGLGPAVAHRILSLFGASVGVENLEPAGIRLTVSLKSVTSNVGLGGNWRSKAHGG